jgi:NAD(P)-dependent dehydrogenase (short-subunit alcohol dehydrogenase family)
MGRGSAPGPVVSAPLTMALPALVAVLAPEATPIGRVVQSADVAAPAVHLMADTALTGATYDIDGGRQFVRGE